VAPWNKRSFRRARIRGAAVELGAGDRHEQDDAECLEALLDERRRQGRAPLLGEDRVGRQLEDELGERRVRVDRERRGDDPAPQERGRQDAHRLALVEVTQAVDVAAEDDPDEPGAIGPVGGAAGDGGRLC
jgi:hypothetical protein